MLSVLITLDKIVANSVVFKEHWKRYKRSDVMHFSFLLKHHHSWNHRLGSLGVQGARAPTFHNFVFEAPLFSLYSSSFLLANAALIVFTAHFLNASTSLVGGTLIVVEASAKPLTIYLTIPVSSIVLYNELFLMIFMCFKDAEICSQQCPALWY